MRNLILLTIVVLVVGSLAAFAQDVEPSKGFRANRTTYSPRMDMLASSRDVEVTDAQLEELKTLQLEAIWDGLGAPDVKASCSVRSHFPIGLSGCSSSAILLR